jgi:AcrR family transcriptional regulator
MQEAVHVRRGRPPKFDRGHALAKAMHLFWEQGYEGTTFDQLLAAMGISASSFQNSFGCKHQVYEEATQLYLEEKRRWFAEALSGVTTTRETFEKLIISTANAFTTDCDPAGCMISLAGTHAAPECDRIRDMMAAKRSMVEEGMRLRLQEGIAAGELPDDTDAAAMAAFFSTVFRGMAVQARDGATREQLLKIGMLAMKAWPEDKKQESTSF